jgi:hypothetical protein
LAILVGVTLSATQKWELGKVNPKADKKVALAALRRLSRTEVKKLLAQKAPEVHKDKG